jgi:hypothetical protein
MHTRVFVRSIRRSIDLSNLVGIVEREFSCFVLWRDCYGYYFKCREIKFARYWYLNSVSIKRGKSSGV